MKHSLTCFCGAKISIEVPEASFPPTYNTTCPYCGLWKCVSEFVEECNIDYALAFFVDFCFKIINVILSSPVELFPDNGIARCQRQSHDLPPMVAKSNIFRSLLTNYTGSITRPKEVCNSENIYNPKAKSKYKKTSKNSN